MIMPLGCRGSVHEAFSEEELETSKAGGSTPSGTGKRKRKTFPHSLLFSVCLHCKSEDLHKIRHEIFSHS